MQPQPPARRPRGKTETELELGCLWPLVVVLAVAIAIVVFIGASIVKGPSGPQQTIVRVIDSSASPGPKVIGTAIVPRP